MFTIKKSKNIIYYYCNSFARKKKCSNRSIKREMLEEIRLEELKNNDGNIEQLNDKILFKYIDKIIINENKTIEIKYK